MFSTFTGSSRRPRNVNLSGRNPNPFTKYGASSGTAGPKDVLANAQQERKNRQEEKERARAAQLVQRTWRGNVARRNVKEQQRQRWDEIEGLQILQDEDAMETDSTAQGTTNTEPYISESLALSQLQALRKFGDFQDEEDIKRLEHYIRRWRAAADQHILSMTGGPWPMAYTRLEDSILSALLRHVSESDAKRLHSVISTMWRVNTKLCLTATRSQQYYRALINADLACEDSFDAVTLPLSRAAHMAKDAYKGFANGFLASASPNSPLPISQTAKILAPVIDTGVLNEAILETINSWSNASSLERLQLLSYTIYFHRTPLSSSVQRDEAQNTYVYTVSLLLSSVADEIRTNLDSDNQEEEMYLRGKSKLLTAVDEFSRQQLESLVNQESISGLLDALREQPQGITHNKSNNNFILHTRTIASYILTLLRLFPQKGDEIRMWLYLGLSKRDSSANSRSDISAIHYFWEATRRTTVYEAILADSYAAIGLLKTRHISTHQHEYSDAYIDIDDQWRVVLIFMEVYSFVLKLMDDQEFFALDRQAGSSMQRPANLQHNALELRGANGVEKLVTFLKHLGFTMYYNAPDILGRAGDRAEKNISGLFGHTRSNSANGSRKDKAQPTSATHIAGVQGISLDYVKKLVTTLLRAIYERDSRRPFLPADHWLMTSKFNMTNFIDFVVEEEERRRSMQEHELEDDNDDEESDDEEEEVKASFVGTGRSHRLRIIEQRNRQQRKASKQRYLQAVAPRLEILQNMPFIIPFKTRVQIFRQFIHMDQVKRREGIVDPETWRLHQSMLGNPMNQNRLSKHQAKIRRDYEFEDALEAFYDLGPALKEPIQITFLDRFGSPEAGIDGGGVTKEFLTSVTTDVFTKSEGIKLFAENEQRLLYPNPSAVDEQKEVLREFGSREGSSVWKSTLEELLKRYEFIGRIIGKCLYEGVLVDIHFAGFFLVKWAFTGNAGSQEGGYQANLNYLRDLDEGLYQGLLQLKNYDGDVEDFGLTFTVTDTLRPATSTSPEKTITRELMRDGSQVTVQNSNRLVYVSYMARHRLSIQPAMQTSAFLRGLSSIIQPSWLSMFNQNELQTLVGGAQSNINIQDLRAHTEYGGVYVIGDDGLEHPTVQLFWQVMEHDLNEEEKGNVLKFVTSTPRAPLLGFGTLQPRFSIRDAGNDQTRLPSTSTCVNLLKLPRYASRGLLRSKLLQAVNSGAGFDLS